MAIQLIPTTPAVAYYSQRTKLDGRDYLLRFSWNEREERWYVSIFDDEENPLVQSIKIICNWRLLRAYHADPRVPPGEIVATDLTGLNVPPGFDELGEGLRVELNYIPVADIAA